MKYRLGSKERRGISLPAQMGVYASAKLLGLRQWGFEDYNRLASELPTPETLMLLAVFNLSLQNGGLEDPKWQYWLAKWFFPEHTAKRILRIYNLRNERFTWLTPIQVRLVMAFLLGHPSNLLSESEVQTHAAQLGEALLSSADFIAVVPDSVDPSSPIWKLKLQLDLVHSGYGLNARGFEEFSVKGYIITKLFEQLQLNEGFFEEDGFTPIQLQTALTAMWAHFKTFTPQFVSSTESYALRFDYMMGQSRIPRKVGEFIAKNYAVEIGKTNETFDPNSPLRLLSERPICMYNGFVFCADIEFLMTRASRELWNLGGRYAKHHKIGAFTGQAGYIFEEYCELFLSSIAKRRARNGARLVDPSLLKRAPVDFLYCEENVAIAIEAKSAPLPVSVIYGTDAEALATAIDEKYIVGRQNDVQGFAQLRKNIQTILESPQAFGLDAATRIMPCLVVTEETLTAAPAYQYATDRASQLFCDLDERVLPPVILHSEELGMLSELSDIASPCKILRSLASSNLGPYFSTKNFIWSEWYPSDGKGLVKMERPVDFLDMALGPF